MVFIVMQEYKKRRKRPQNFESILRRFFLDIYYG